MPIWPNIFYSNYAEKTDNNNNIIIIIILIIINIETWCAIDMKEKNTECNDSDTVGYKDSNGCKATHFLLYNQLFISYLFFLVGHKKNNNNK